jgi:hypothetical protein
MAASRSHERAPPGSHRLLRLTRHASSEAWILGVDSGSETRDVLVSYRLSDTITTLFQATLTSRVKLRSSPRVTDELGVLLTDEEQRAAVELLPKLPKRLGDRQPGRRYVASHEHQTTPRSGWSPRRGRPMCSPCRMRVTYRRWASVRDPRTTSLRISSNCHRSITMRSRPNRRLSRNRRPSSRPQLKWS